MSLNPNVRRVKIRTIRDLQDALDKFPQETEIKLIAAHRDRDDNVETEFYGIDIVNMVDNLGVEIGSTEQLQQ